MSPSSMSSGSRIQLALVIFVLVIHSIWIANHLRWVANDQVNPWKLGGYGMYTVPAPDVRIHTYMVSPTGGIGTMLDPDSYKLSEFRRSFGGTSPERIFRCAPVEPAHLRAFFEENPQLRGVNLFVVFSERRFSRDPVGLQRQEQGRVQVQWIGDRDLVYGSLFCGNMVTGEASL